LVHSEADTPVSIGVFGDSRQVQVHVENSGRIAKHVKGQLFRRFVSTRIDKGGSGLGLAIVRAVAEAHGGQVELAQAGPPTVVVCLTLPTARTTRGLPNAAAADEPGASA
jgi:signal transduction histidine kinase